MSIRSELEARIIQWASAQVPEITVALENVPFTKPTTGSFVEVFFLSPVVIHPDVAAATERETGIFQVNCCVRKGNGAKAGEDLADAIKSLFPVLPKTGTVSITRPPQKAMAIDRDDGFRVTPVTISYRK